ncbi:MAG: VWA domain-containing protein [Pirellulaceae bacterium]|nr:VWA domain-containing protein [Pirellulaceae bacterium]
MKPVPPPLPKKAALVSAPQIKTQSVEGNHQTTLMLVGLAVLLLITLGLLILIVSLTRNGDGTSTQGVGASIDAGTVGKEQGNTAGENVEVDKAVGPPNDSTQTDSNPVVAPPQSTSPEETQPTKHSEETVEGVSESEAEAHEVEPDELPKGARVIPLFSEPSAASAPTLETSNPFLDAGKANSIVFVIDKSSSMSQNFGRVINALNQAIDGLSEDQSFQLIFFDDAPRQNPNSRGLVKATKRNKDAMKKWVENHVTADGSTEPLAAVSLAIDLSPQRIIILSDGEFHPQYVEAITQYNYSTSQGHIRIDCIGLNEVVESLQQIARRNGPGIYYQAR